MTARRAWRKRGWAVVLASMALQAPLVCLHAGGVQAERETPKAPGTVSLLPPRALLRWHRHEACPITTIAFSPDGKVLAVAEASTRFPHATLFDTRTGRALKVLTLADPLESSVISLAFAPDSSKLTWGESSGFVALWDLPSERLLFRETLHSIPVRDVAFSPDGKVMASSGASIRLRRVADPDQFIRDFTPGIGADGDRRIVGRDPGVFPGGPFRFAFTPDGKQLIVASVPFATISVWRIDDGGLVRVFDSLREDRAGSPFPILKYVAVTADGRRVFSASTKMVPIAQTRIKYGESDVEMAEIRCWDFQTGKPIWSVHGPLDHGPGKAALSPDGKRLVVADYGVLRTLEAETGELDSRTSFRESTGMTPVFSPDGSSFAMPVLNTVALFDATSRRRIRRFEQAPEGEVTCAAWSPAGDRLVSGHADGEIRVWQTATGKLVWHKLLAPVKSPTGLIRATVVRGVFRRQPEDRRCRPTRRAGRIR